MTPPEAFEYNRNLAAGKEQLGIRLWQMTFPRIAEIRVKLDGDFMTVEPRSTLSLDDRYLGWWRGGSLHRSAINSSWDSLQAVQVLLETGAIPMTALYPLLRAAVENASLALYLLEPDDRDARLLHSYRVADDEAKWQCTFATTTGKEDASIGRLRARVELLGLIKLRTGLGSPRAVKLRAPKYGELVELAEAAVKADPKVPNDPKMPLLGWWQLMSRMSHGKQWAQVAALDRQEAVEKSGDESAHVRMSSNPVVIGLAIQRAVETLETVMRLYERRAKAPGARPEDAAEPAPQPYSELRAERRGSRG